MSESAPPMKIEIWREEITSPVAGSLIEAPNAELARTYPEGANHFRLDPEEVAEGRGAFPR